MLKRIAFALVLLLPFRLDAQLIDSATVAARHRREVVGDIAIGSRVRLTTNTYSSAEGRLSAVRGDTIVVSTVPPRAVAIDDVRMLWVGERQVKHGAIVGGATGGILLGLTDAVLSAGFCEAADCSSSARDGFFAGAPIGLILGGVIGAGIGALMTGWDRIL